LGGRPQRKKKKGHHRTSAKFGKKKREIYLISREEGGGKTKRGSRSLKTGRKKKSPAPKQAQRGKKGKRITLPADVKEKKKGRLLPISARTEKEGKRSPAPRAKKKKKKKKKLIKPGRNWKDARLFLSIKNRSCRRREGTAALSAVERKKRG